MIMVDSQKLIIDPISRYPVDMCTEQFPYIFLYLYKPINTIPYWVVYCGTSPWSIPLQ